MTKIPPDQASKISSDVDFAAQGLQHGHLSIPHSRNTSPWGSILMPVSVFNNAEGPTVLFTGASHGDEYEGPIALMTLMRTLDLKAIKGRIIIIPALNYPALKAGTRLSPIDGKNMNRAFPGDRNGTVTEMVADYVQRFILPLCDCVLDIHAGGRMMRFAPITVIHRLADKGQMARTIAAARAFGAPNCLVLEELDAHGMLDTAVEDLGTVFVSTELGGSATTSVETVQIAKDGVHNILVHLGILDGPLRGPGTTRFLETPDDAFVIAGQDGILEMTVEPGDSVCAGDIIALIHDIDAPTVSPAVYRAPVGGIMAQRHDAGMIARGDCLSVIAVETDDYANP